MTSSYLCFDAGTQSVKVAAFAAGDMSGGQEGLKTALRRSLRVTGCWAPGPRPDLSKIPFSNREDRS